MSDMKRFEKRISALPEFPKIYPGYELVEVTPKHYILHSGLESFQLHCSVPGIKIPDLFKKLNSSETLSQILCSLSIFEAAFLLEVLEKLNASRLLVSSKEKKVVDFSQNRYYYNTLFMQQITHLKSHQLTEDVLYEKLPEKDWIRILQTANVGLIGLGRIGSLMARLLGIVGVRHLYGIDNERVDEALLLTDAWYDKTDLNLLRIEAISRRLLTIDKEIEFKGEEASLNDLGNLPEELFQQDLLVLATDYTSLSLLELINKACIQARIPWISYRIDVHDLTIEIGPMVYPGETACFSCYLERRRENSFVPNIFDAVNIHFDSKKLPLSNMQITPCVSLLCNEVIRFFSKTLPPLTYNTVLSYNFLEGEMRKHLVLKNPRCKVCSRVIEEFMPTRFWGELQSEWGDE